MFEKYILENKDYLKIILSKAEDINNQSPISCKTISDRERLIPTIITSPQFQEKSDIEMANQEGEKNTFDAQDTPEEEKKEQLPYRGLWIEHIKQNGCEKLSRLNILVAASSDNLPKTFMLKPGTTIADIQLQQQIENVIRKAVVETSIRCGFNQQFSVLNTKLEGFFNEDMSQLVKSDNHNGWQERWTVNACDNIVDIQVKMIPSKKEATGFTVKAVPY